jgi:hypothetical protein
MSVGTAADQCYCFNCFAASGSLMCLLKQQCTLLYCDLFACHIDLHDMHVSARSLRTLTVHACWFTLLYAVYSMYEQDPLIKMCQLNYAAYAEAPWKVTPTVF